jgi:HD-like signal output (HDOD) protein
MGLFDKIRRHAAVSRGDFDTMFKDVEIPPLPVVVNQLLSEINKPDPDIDQLVKLISASPEIAAKTIQTVNSALFSPRLPVADVKRAVTLLGLKNIRSIALAYATMDALPKPPGRLFDHGAFWSDSLLQATLSRAFSQKKFSSQVEEVFTASLLADLAIPVLLCVWREYYEPVVDEWNQSARRLSEIEREHFGWDHAQAGAWIIQSWEFPEEMICYLGLHNISMEKIKEAGLEDTIVVPMAVAAMTPSVLKPDADFSKRTFQAAVEWLAMDSHSFVESITEVKESLGEILELFGLPDRSAIRILNDLVAVAKEPVTAEEI